MSYCKKEGKDEIIFATKEDLAVPSTAIIKIDVEAEEQEEPGLILPSGEINWNCPCLGGMASGPCGVQFREAFSCFHYSEAEPKGSDCYEHFRKMQECMAGYPELYPGKEDEEESKEFSDIGGTKVDEVQTDSANAGDDEGHKVKDVSSAS